MEELSGSDEEEIIVIEENEDEEEDLGPEVDECTSVTEEASDSFCCVAIHPSNPRFFAAGAQDDTLRIYDIQDADTSQKAPHAPSRLIARWRISSPIFEDTVTVVKYSFDGRYLAAGGCDGSVAIFDAKENYEKVAEMKDAGCELEWMVWHPRGYVVLAGASDGTTWMWWAPSGVVMQTFVGHSTSVVSGSFSHDGKFVCTGSGDGTVLLFCPKTGACHVSYRRPTSGTPLSSSLSQEAWHDGAVLSLHTTLHEKSQIMATGGEDGVIKLTNIETGRMLGSLCRHEDSVTTLAFRLKQSNDTSNGSKKGKFDEDHLLLASGSLDNTVCIWDCSRSDVKYSLTLSGDMSTGVVKVLWHPVDPNMLFIASTEALWLWDIRQKDPLEWRRGHTDGILDCDVQIVCSDTNGEMDSWCRLVSCSDDKTCRVWDKW